MENKILIDVDKKFIGGVCKKKEFRNQIEELREVLKGVGK